MQSLPSDYVLALAGQIASLSAFLGGFAATFFATLLTLGELRRLTTVTTSLAASASVAFVVALVAGTRLTAMLHPAAPARLAAGSTAWPQALMTLGFLLGTLLLLVSIGCSGWLRSRAIGWTTATAAGLGALAILSLTVQLG